MKNIHCWANVHLSLGKRWANVQILRKMRLGKRTLGKRNVLRRAYAEIRVASCPQGKKPDEGRKKAKKRQERYRGQENAKYCKKSGKQPRNILLQNA